jgi:hypothetical protein
MTTKGAMVAAAVAGLMAAGTPALVHAKGGGKVSCQGVNDCKGKGGCKSATNDCKGKNECKGKGIMKMSEKDCTGKGGTVAPAEEKK